jgi:hypothetical protein
MEKLHTIIFIILQFYNDKRMKSRVIISLLAIMLLTSLQFMFLSSVQAKSQKNESDCDSSYPAICILSPPPNLNCNDISDKNFEVLPSDSHGFDRDDEDSIGCES